MTNPKQPDNRLYLAYDEWFAEVYPYWYGKLMDETEGPYGPLRHLLTTLPGLANRAPSSIEILDCACGAGSTFIPLTRAGYRAWGSDGSRMMLRQALSNSRARRVPTGRLVRRPLDWRDGDAFRKLRGGRPFDVVIAMSNSLCHLPAVPGHLDVALTNLHAALKPGGRLIVDTKKFVARGRMANVDLLREQRFRDGNWVERDEKSDARHVPGLGDVDFHTSMHYDRDPAFGICRALVAVTVHGPSASPHTRLLMYYPLTAETLDSALVQAGFDTAWHSAMSQPLGWSYDLVVATKRSAS